ncbi:enoyl-CoA hydratase/isomerase family protein [Sphingobium sp. Sx8-8]|uniref:enoyl-CoA hydratase/isomerase family protein n=1 Tax=Sphingobium sp. Sx8-8 TaxID=2933617 RepID=UPI001F58F5C9|nr:enoyl-CoA hydratase/isomerase family protein [Sphingobium sp. Sx8-8]
MAGEFGQLVTVTERDGYAIVTLNRPDKRNAMSYAAQKELWAALDHLGEERCKVIVLTGAGDVSFCSGADIKDKDRPTLVAANAPDSWHQTQDIIARHSAVFIAAVNGFALGGGLTLVNNCELAIASETATFGIPEIGMGIFAALAGPSTIKRLTPKHTAEMLFTGKRIDAATAYRMGLVNEVVPPAELLPRAEALAAHIAQFDAVALDYNKKAFRDILDMNWAAGMDYGIRSTAVIRSKQQALAQAQE